MGLRPPFDLGVLDQHRRSNAAVTASTLRRLCGAVIDAALLLPIYIYLAASDIPNTTRIFPAIVAAYHLLLVPTLGATLGMLVCRMRVVSDTGVRPPRWRIVVFALMRSIPIALLTGSIALFEAGNDMVATFMMISGFSIGIVHMARIHFSKSGRGVFDALAGVAVVWKRRGETP
jgi:uncharacterized RDD family membrane protein YckC